MDACRNKIYPYPGSGSMENDGFKVQHSRSSKSRRERALSSASSMLSTGPSGMLPEVIPQQHAVKQFETAALTSNETERERLWQEWSGKLAQQPGSKDIVEYSTPDGRFVSFETVLRGSNAIGLSVQTAVQVPGTAVANMLQSLEKLLGSFSLPRLDNSHITRLTSAVQGFSGCSSPDVLEAYRESLPAVIAAILQGDQSAQSAAAPPAASAADIEAALAAQAAEGNGSCTRDHVDDFLRTAEAARQHARLQLGGDPQAGATTAAARLVALAEKKALEAKDLASKRLSPKDLQAQANREFAEEDRRFAIALQRLAEEEADLQAKLNEVLRRRREAAAQRAQLQHSHAASLSQDPKQAQRRMKAMDQDALEAQLVAARQLQGLLDGAAPAPPAAAPADGSAALALYGQAASCALRAGVRYLEEAKDKMQTTVKRLKRVQKQGEEIKIMKLPAAQLTVNAKSQTLLQQAVAETLASAASVADSCTTAALGLQQHSGIGGDGAGDGGIKRSLAAVADLVAAVKTGMHGLQALAAEVALPKRRQAADVPPPAETVPAGISPQRKR